MSAREDLIYRVTRHCSAETAEQMVDAYRAEVLAEADERFAAMTLPEEYQHTLNAASYRHAWQDCRAAVQSMCEEKATPAGATATPQLTERQAWLLDEIRVQGGHWKSGRVVNAYRLAYFGTVHVNDARADLIALRDAGHLIQHDESGVRFYTLNSRKDVRP